jgi:Smg protein
MFDIFIYLFESYFDAGSCPDPNKLTVKLSAAGFEDDEISQAVTWLSGLRQLSLVDYPVAINHSAPRSFATLERQRICIDGLRFISFWEHNKFITPVEREMIFDRALALGRNNLSLDKIKLITLMVLWNQHDNLDPMIIEDLLTPANSAQLH